MAVLHDATELKTLEAQFVQSQKMQAIGQLAGGVAHDFRNQLQVIRGFGWMLMKEPSLSDEARQRMQYILDAVERSTQLTGQLLAFSRKETLMLPTVDFCGLTVTRLIIGANPFGGYSHQNPERDSEMRAYLPLCDDIRTCRNLNQLAAFIRDLVL